MRKMVRLGLQVAGVLVWTAVWQGPMGLAAQAAAQQAPATAGTPGRSPAPTQVQGATSPAQPAAVTPVDAGRMSLDVTVTDKKGNPIPGLQLQQKDFTLLDNGQPRELVGFRAVDTSADPNRVHLLIVVDMINARFDRIAYEREQLGEFLSQNGGKLSHPTAIAVMTDTTVKMMGGATQDGHALNENFQKVGTDLRILGRDAGFYGRAERIETSISELRQIVAYEATQPGRNLVVVISPGWPMLALAGVEEDMQQREWVFSVLEQMTDEIRMGHVALYSVDPMDLGRTDPFYYQAYLKPVKKVDQAEYPTLSLQVLAEHSGGRALTMGRDVLGEINAVVRDEGTYYKLTFDTKPADKPNEYHDLQVKVDQPGLVARTSAGIYEMVQPIGKKMERPSKIAKPY